MKILLQFVKVLLALFALFIVVVLIFYGHADLAIEGLKKKYAPEPSAFARVDGMDVHYRDEGPESDTLPIVLIHGTSSSLHTFDSLTAELKRTRRVIRMDMPGFGLTGPFPDRDYSIDQYVEFLADFLRTMQIDSCILAGNSLGGHIAWAFTAKHSKKVKKLILIDAAGYPTKSKSTPVAFTVARTPVLKQLMTYITPRPLVRASVENVYANKSKVTEDLVDRYFELSLREGNRQALVDRFSVESDTSMLALIKLIHQPTLILWGSEDRLIPVENAQRFHRDLPNSTLVIMDDSGHVPMEENPEATLARIIDFIGR